MKKTNCYSNATDLSLLYSYEDFIEKEKPVPVELIQELIDRDLKTGFGDLYFGNCLSEKLLEIKNQR